MCHNSCPTLYDSYPCSRQLVQIVRIEHCERHLAFIVRLPGDVDFAVNLVADTAASALERGREIHRKQELEGVGVVTGRNSIALTTAAYNKFSSFLIASLYSRSKLDHFFFFFFLVYCTTTQHR